MVATGKDTNLVGQFAINFWKKSAFLRPFIGVNGIDGHSVSTTNKEGNGNAIILNNAIEKYVVADNSKFDSYSFYSFYHVEDLQMPYQDMSIPKKIKDKYALYNENHLRSRGWDKSTSLDYFWIVNKTQWLSGLYYAGFHQLYSPTNLVRVGRRNRILTNYRFRPTLLLFLRMLENDG